MILFYFKTSFHLEGASCRPKTTFQRKEAGRGGGGVRGVSRPRETVTQRVVRWRQKVGSGWDFPLDFPLTMFRAKLESSVCSHLLVYSTVAGWRWTHQGLNHIVLSIMITMMLKLCWFSKEKRKKLCCSHCCVCDAGGEVGGLGPAAPHHHAQTHLLLQEVNISI